MTLPQTAFETDVSLAFIQISRGLIAEYLSKIERCVDRLTDEQVWSRANPESNSIGNLLLHLSGNMRQWIVCGLGTVSDQRQRQAEFDEQRIIPRQELLDKLRLTIREADAVLDGFDLKRLLDAYVIQGIQSTALAAIFHVTEHLSMHTGQIILLTKQLTATDLHFYDL